MKSARLWDIFCKVVDNYGDIGVCWRLAADLAARGHQVRLWTDDTSALAWIAPGALDGGWPGVQVLPWDQSRDAATLAGLLPADVWVEGFGCDLPAEFLRHRLVGPEQTLQRAPPPVWINLEYLSAEPFVERSHGLPSPVMHGPARGCARYFFYPGFSPRTGGLLREPDLARRQAAFEREQWLAAMGLGWRGERLASLFCYEPAALPDLLILLRQNPQPTRLLVTDGRAAAAVGALLGVPGPVAGPGPVSGALSTTFLPRLAQIDFDHLLWSCELNFVRGEDSLVRALWAGRPFVWQIYPQHDNAHRAKLQAFLDTVKAPSSWRRFHAVWNGITDQALEPPDLPSWGAAATQAMQHLARQSDLTSRLLRFVDTVGARIGAN